VKALGDMFHEGLGRGSSLGKGMKLLEKFFLPWRHVIGLMLEIEKLWRCQAFVFERPPVYTNDFLARRELHVGVQGSIDVLRENR
jgi:hypothetical protein